MVETLSTSDVAEYNDRSLKTLDRAITFSQGEFSLVFVRCNYKRLRERIMCQLRERCANRYEIRELDLPSSVTTLYTTIQALVHGDGEMGRQGGEFTEISQQLSPSATPATPAPCSLFILGLESVEALDDLLTSTNQVRDEFRKRLPFPLVLWVNDEVLQKLVKFAPDFASWAAAPIKFEIATSELTDFLRQKADSLFKIILNCSKGRYAPWHICTHHSSLNLATGCRSRAEIDSALKDLQRHGQAIDPELEASLLFVLGQYDYASDLIDSALTRYQRSLKFWRATHNLERQGVLLFHLGLCYCRQADLHQTQRNRHWEEARPYLQQCIEVLEQAERPDLVAQFITQQAEVLERLQAWDALQITAQKSLTVHQSYGFRVQLAQDFGFVAEVALHQLQWEDAKTNAKHALAVLVEVSEQPAQHQGLHHFLLAQLYLLFLVKALRQLGQLEEAYQHLEVASLGLQRAIAKSEHHYEPQRYLFLLEELRTLYFEQSRYLEAFRIKQEQRAVEQLYGFRAFIGAARLQPRRPVTNPTLAPVEQQEIVAQEIEASGRKQDVNRLIERMGRSDYKLTVIHGQSGVGKSSIVSAGLVPALKHKTIGDRIALPVVLQVYTDWMGELGKSLAQALYDFGINEGEELINLRFTKSQAPQKKIQNILEQLRQNAEHNLLTILVFDQFEEFFFVSPLSQKILFYEFIEKCLNSPFVKVILSLREDYLHYLLEIEQFNLEIIDNNILDRKIRYPLGNFSLEDARCVIERLTERAHFYLEPVLIDELVRDLADGLEAVRPIELQVVGAQLQVENITTLAQYQQSGPKQKLVERFLEQAVKDCGPENEHAAWLVLHLLTDENDSRPLKTRAELAAESAIKSEKLDLILEILEKSGLVFLLPEVPAKRYQLVHDYLVEFIRQKKQLTIQKELEELRKRDKLSQVEIERLKAELREKELRAKLAQATAKQKKAEAQLNQVLKKSLREARFIGVALFTISLIAALLGMRAAISETNAQLNELSASSEALAASNRQFDALLKSLRAGGELKRSIWVTPETRMRVITSLQQAVYGVKEYKRLEGHKDWVSSVSWSPDGQRLVSGSKDGTMKLWNTDGTLSKTLTPSHQGGVYSVSYRPDGKMIASSSEDTTVKLWSAEGVLLHQLQGHSAPVSSVAWSADGKAIATASWDKTVKLWSSEGTLLNTLKGHNDRVLGVSLSPDGELIASASKDQKITLWRQDGTFLTSWQAHEGAVTSVSFSPDSQILASTSADKTVKLWRRDGTLLNTLTGHNNWVVYVTFSRDGQMMASASADNTVKIWKTDGTLIDTLKGHGNLVQGVSFSPNGQTLASASADNTIKLWYRDRQLLKVLKRHTDAVNNVSFSPDRKIIATASDDHTVKLWDRDGVLLAVLDGHKQGVNHISFNSDGKMMATASDDRTVKLWKTDGTLLKTLVGHEEAVTSVSFSLDDTEIASSSSDRTVKLWQADGTFVKTLKGHEAGVRGVSFSPDGELIASASEDKTVKLWRRNGQLLATLKHNGAVNWVSFSPDGKLIASASSGGTVNLWHRDSWWKRDRQPIATLKHNGAVYWVSFSPDGQLIASASEDKTVNLWSRSGNLIKTLEGHTDEVYGVSFSQNGKWLASGSKDQTVILWNLDLDELLKRGCRWLDDYFPSPNLTGREASSLEFQALCEDIQG